MLGGSFNFGANDLNSHFRGVKIEISSILLRQVGNVEQKI